MTGACEEARVACKRECAPALTRGSLRPVSTVRRPRDESA
jgi:hypothetical protein